MTGRPDARRDVDIDTDIPLVRQLGCSRVQTNPDFESDAVRPCLRPQSARDAQRDVGGRRARREDGEELIGPRVDLLAASDPADLAQKAPLFGQNLGVSIGQLLQ